MADSEDDELHEVKDDHLSIEFLSKTLSDLLLLEETESGLFISEHKNVIAVTVHYNHIKKDLELLIVYKEGTIRPPVPKKWTELVPIITFIPQKDLIMKKV